MQTFVMIGLFVVIFYFLLIRPQQKKQKEHQAMLGKLATGDEVVTTGGIVGRIVEISDNFITLEISEGVRIKVQRFHVTSLVPKGTLKGA
jgi:preprotein translocase subunit YajC